MKTKKYNKFIKTFAIVPFLATSLSLSSINHTILSSYNLISANIKTEIVDEKKIEEERVEKAEKIDQYFEKRDMPLSGYGMKMVLEAEKYDLDWRLIPGIAVRESTGGKFACKSKPNNPFGWGSCKIGFDSMDIAIEKIAMNLAGENPNTARYYKDKTNEEKLRAYNPPSIVPEYVPQVLSIMDTIENEG